MNKIRRWLNKPKKKENQLMIQPLTPGRTPVACDDFTVITEMQSSTPERLATPLLDLRDLLQGDSSQDASDIQNCPEPLKTTTVLRCSGQTSTPLPVCSLLQVEKVTGDRMQAGPMDTRSCNITGILPVGVRATNTPGTFNGLPVRSSLKTRDDFSLPSSPHSGGSGRLPCSLPCSPLLGGRHWRSSPLPAPPPSGLSRLWVEAALQRSKQTDPRNRPPVSPQVRLEGEEQVVRSGGGERELDEDDDNEEEDKQVVGIRLLDTFIFRLITPPSICGRKKEEVEEMSRCPSAPPYEAEVFSAGDIQPVSSLSSEDQRHNEGLTQLSEGMDVQSFRGGTEQTLPRHRTPHLGESSGLYPSLSLWRVTEGSQTELNKKQEQEVNSYETHVDHNTIQSCSLGNSTDDHLQWLQKIISGGPADPQTLCSADWSFILKKAFDSTTCSKWTAHPVESCSLCSDNLNVQIMKHLCRSCDQVFCHNCLCRFESLLQIHQFSGV